MEPLLIGVLLDVSWSMQNTSTEGADTRDGEWARSIFTTIDNLIKNDLKPNNHIFAIGFGGSSAPEVFDLLGSLEDLENISNAANNVSLETILKDIVGILETNGARTLTKWAPMHNMMVALTGKENECNLILKRLSSDSNFVRYVVDDCLPPACRDYKESSFVGNQLVTGVFRVFNPFYRGNDVIADAKNKMYENYASKVSQVHQATKKDIDEAVEKMIKGLKRQKPVSDRSIFDVRAAHRILHGHVGDDYNELTKERIDELMDDVRPYIYGGTPLGEAINKSAILFSQYSYRDHKKLLFVLSDGQPTDTTDGGIIDAILTTFTSFDFYSSARLGIILSDITVVSCLITPSERSMIEPYVLYSSATNTQQWGNEAKFMFKLSSAMFTQNVPRTIFVKHQWKVEMINNETKLFLQVNHPDHLKDACDFGHEVVTSQEALSEVLASVDLDVYINQSNDQFDPQTQVGRTCYANASAAVMHLAMNRILGRDGGVPEFASLRDEMTNCYRKQPGGEQGADTRIVLNEMCPRYRLRCEKVDKSRAMRAIMEKRPVVARFRLTNREWNRFGSFFAPRSARDEPDILTSDEIKIHSRKPNEKTSGHAVVLTSFNSKCLRFMNSWGTEWGDAGFFNVQDADVLDFEFFDVYWNEGDLTPDERAYYAAHGSDVADSLMKSLIGLQKSTFECPLCKITSKVTEFKGRLSSVSCPKCRRNFKCGKKGNILALNLYLTSLS